MTYYDGGFSGRAVTLRLEVNTQSQNISANTSVVSWALYAFKGSGVTAWNNDPSYWKVQIDGQEWLGSWTYNWGTQSQITLASGTKTVSHNQDGTKSISVYADASDPTGYLGFASCGGTYTLATIPRASTPSYTNPMTIGTAYTINTNRASSGFTHIIDYYFGSVSGRALTNVGASGVWTPPMELLNQIPNAASGTGYLRTHTYSGGTMIGYKDTSLTLQADASIVPTFDTVTHAEATPGVAANVGAYVQGVSTLALAITGAAGTYGSTIKSYSIAVAGQALSGQTVTSGPLGTAGASVPIEATITDSRGRTASKTVNIPVLAYAPPSLTSIVGQRALVSGAPDDEGTYVRVDINAAVQSLLNGTERNALTYRVYSRLRGATVWTLKANVAPGGVSFNGYALVSPYTVDEAWEFRVEVVDDFATSGYEFTIATSAIFQHWDNGDGIGIGKYREQGMLDVLGQVYQNNGAAVLDVVQIEARYRQALLDPTYRGPGPARVTFLDGGGLSTVAYQWLTPYVPWGSRVVNMEQRGGQWFITGQSASEGQGGKIALTPTPGSWVAYREAVAEPAWQSPYATRLPSGIVVLSGLIRAIGTPALDSVIAVLPPGYRPDSAIHMAVNQSDVARAVVIKPDGVIRTSGSGWSTNGFVSLDGLAFPAAGVASWTNVGDGGSAWGANFEQWADTATWGVPGFWKDPYGFVWTRGLARVKVATSVDNTSIFTLPASHRAGYELHMRTTSNEGYGGIGARTTDGLNWKPNTAGAVGNWIGLGNVVFPTVDASASTEWLPLTNFASSWAIYTGGVPGRFPPPGVMRREDGLCIGTGVVSGGTVGITRAALLPREYWPETRIIVEGIGNNARTRFDLSGVEELETARGKGGFAVVQGSNAWVSLDNLKWMAG